LIEDTVLCIEHINIHKLPTSTFTVIFSLLSEFNHEHEKEKHKKINSKTLLMINSI
jgi:hypothetical protein